MIQLHQPTIKTLTIALVSYCLGLPAIRVACEPTQVDFSESATNWRVDAESRVWLLGMSGDVGIGPIQADIDANFGDILEASDSLLAFSGRLEVGHGPVAGFIDGMWAKIGVEDASGPGGLSTVDVTNELGIVDFGFMFRVYEGVILDNAQPSQTMTTLDVYGGARYITLDLELDPSVGGTQNRDIDWFDPIVGMRIHQPIKDRLHLDLSGDVGGFGIESDLTWSAMAVAGYDFTVFDNPARVYAGYRVMGWDYSQGSGASGFEWDVVLHGPTLGFELMF